MTCFRLPICLSFFSSCLLAVTASADFPDLFNSEPEAVPAMMPAQQAAAEMDVPEGFSVEVFASEPEVQNPIDMAWDAGGRLWVAENYTYAERSQRFQLDLRDRVLVFEDTDGDRRHDKRTVFTDGVQMLTSVEVGHGGVWLMCPPKVLFIPDADRDAKPDGPAQVVLDGFTVAKQNYHNFANGLRFGPDGWLYGRCGGSCPGRIGAPGTPDEQRVALEGGIWRYHPVRKHVEVLTAGTTNPWGHDWNAVGEMFFVNTVNGHLWHMIPGAHFTRPFTLDPNRHTYELIDFHADHWHFDTGKSWTDSRDGAANAYGGGHAHCGTMIYQGGTWPEEYHGKLFTLNLHGRRANQEILKRKGSGYVASHGDDIMLAADPWFRGMELSYGPDGQVVVIDWSDTGECHEHTGVHRTSGRIFSVHYDPASDSGDHSVDLRSLDSVDLAAFQHDENQWWVRQSRLVLAERAAAGQPMEAAAEVLRRQFQRSASDAPRAVANLLTLHVIGQTNVAFLKRQLRHDDQHVRVWALRLLTESWSIDDVAGPTYRCPATRAATDQQADELLAELKRLARTDSSGLVHLTLASTLQRLPADQRSQLAVDLVAHDRYAGDHNLPLMIWYGLMPVADAHPEQLVSVAQQCALPTTRRLIARRLAEEVDANPAPLNRLLRIVAEDSRPDWRLDILSGVAEALKGWRRATEPEAWDAVVANSQDPELETLVRELSVVFGDGRALDEVKRIALDSSADPDLRLSALETLIQNNPPDLREVCEPLLTDARMNVLAARGLSSIGDREIAELLIRRYRNFRGPKRPQVISILTSRPSFARPLLEAIADGKIPREDLSAFGVRQLQSLGEVDLSRRVAEVWGEVRATPEKQQQQIGELKQSLSPDRLAAANRSRGRVLFEKTCQNCHRLYGEGGEVGPDLTGSDRSNLDYLLSNIVDPSGVVDKDYRMTIVLLDDGRIVSGLVTAETGRTVTVHTESESMTLDRRQIEDRKVTEKSPMPEGLLENLSPEQIRDLVAYLTHPSQVPRATATAGR